MVMWTITHACGHEEEHDISGPIILESQGRTG